MNLSTLYKISYGMYIVSSKKENNINGQIANTVFQVTSTPPTLAVSINKENLTHAFIRESKIFTVSILSQTTPMTLIGNFGFKSGHNIDKFKDINYKSGITGAPIVLESVIGYLEAEVINMLDVGTHTIFVGNIIEAESISDGIPMTYAYYHQIKGGKAPPTAPTYIKEELKKEEGKMEKYKCTVCGYIYDPQKGDPDAGIKPGTTFDALPNDWVCPVCGAGKEAFVREN